MSTFAEDLRRGVAKSLLPQQEENPLRTIGLSPSILELGLSDDELYEFCKKMARSLVVHFHPDRVSSQAVAYQERFARAFEALKKPEVFDSSLAEFRQQHNELASDTSREKRTAKTERELIDELQVKLAVAEDLVKNTDVRIDAIKAKFLAHMRLRGVGLSESVSRSLGAVGIQQAVRLNLLVFSPYTPCSLANASTLRQIQAEYDSTTARRGWNPRSREGFAGLLRGTGASAGVVEELFKEAIDSDEQFPVIHWSLADGCKKLGFKGFGRYTFPKPGPPSSIRTNLSTRKLSSLYRDALISLAPLFSRRSEGVGQISVHFESITIHRGFVSFGTLRYPILGSLRSEDINPQLFHLVTSSDVPDSIILEKLHPLLIQGQLLVRQSMSQLYKVENLGNYETGLNDAGRYLGGNKVESVLLEAIPGDPD